MTSRLKRRKSARTKEVVRRDCPAHESWIRGFECSIPGCNFRLFDLPIECAHVRNSELTPPNERGGLGLKPHSKWTLPLCTWHHAELHRFGEAAFQKLHSIDLGIEAQNLAKQSPHKWRWADETQ